MMVVVMAYSLSHGIRQKDELLVQIWQLLLPGTMTFWASGEEERVLSSINTLIMDRSICMGGLRIGIFFISLWSLLCNMILMRFVCSHVVFSSSYMQTQLELKRRKEEKKLKCCNHIL